MHRTTIFLPEELDASLKRLASAQSRSKAELIREALERFMADSRPALGELPPGVGQFDSGESDISERAEELLWRDPE